MTDISDRQKVVILGGGFAGLNLIKKLDESKYEIHLVDRNNFHSFPPLYYQVASSGLEPSNICFPFRREIKKKKSVRYHMGNIKNVDLANKSITTSYETLTYDRLIIAVGTGNNFFGHDDLEEGVFCMKTEAEAARTRDEILDRLERGALEPNEERRRKLLSFLVIGGGASGVEIAGALGEMKRYILPREYPELDPDDMSITLIEGGESLLSAMSVKSQRNAYKYLSELLVDIRLNTMMTDYKDKMLTFADGHSEYWETVIWTAGVGGIKLPGLPQEILGRGGRIIVDEYSRVKGYEDTVCAIGDIALMTSEEYPKGHPQMAQPAIQQAVTLAKNMNKNTDPSKFDKKFKYFDKGSMATIGRNRAVADIGKIHLGGKIAWFAWMFIHLISIIGIRNKLTILINWTWNYFTYSTSLRLLLRPSKYPLRKHWGA